MAKVLRMQTFSQSVIVEEKNSSSELSRATASALTRMNRERLFGLLRGVGAPQSISTTKSFLVSKLLEIRDYLLASDTVSGTTSARDSCMSYMPE